MADFYLFTATPPAASPHGEIRIDVPERLRAELYREELEQTRLLFEAYARRRPEVAEVLNDPRLLETLALVLDDYVGPAVATDINAFRRQSNPTGTIDQAYYDDYVAACLQRTVDPYRASADWRVAASASTGAAWGGLASFYRRYPMVRYMVGVVTTSFQRNIQLCCDRVLEDWVDLGTFFFGGVALDRLTRIQSTGSDFHKGGGQVLILHFIDTAAAAQQLVYKPTDVERDFRLVGDTLALGAALANLNVMAHKGVTLGTLLNSPTGSVAETFNGLPALPAGYAVATYRILPVWPGSSLGAPVAGTLPIRKSYGYLEFLSNTLADKNLNAGQLQTFYRSFGALTALCWLLQVTDLHQENLIVHAQLPTLIDLEMTYSGLMELPSSTNLAAAYGTFTVGSTRRRMEGWGTANLYYGTGGFPAEPTKNQPWQGGVAHVPDANDKLQLVTAFTNSVQLLLANRAAFDACINGGANMVTRILPFGTALLLTLLRRLNDPGDQLKVTFPDEVTLRLQDFADSELQGWGDQFRAVASPVGGVLAAADLELIYDAQVPRFAMWLDPQTADDFRAGDVPAFYQRVGTSDAMGSSGRTVVVAYGLGVLGATAVNQQPLSNALVTQWGTAAPLLPQSYFPQAIGTMQRNYLTRMQNDVANFGTQRTAAAAQDLANW